jgi:hypothetical protein
VRILELVEDSAARKAKTESFISRFARVYTPVVVIGPRFSPSAAPFLLGGLERMAETRADFPCHILSLRAGYLRPAGLFSAGSAERQGAAY